VIEPLSAVKVGMEETSSTVSGVQATVNSIQTRQEKVETLLNDVKANLGLVLKQLEQASQTAPVSAVPSASDAAAILFASAQSDKLEGRLEFALTTFGDISTKYPESPLAPKAVFEIGSIYAQNEQYTDAVKAFDRVLEQFGDNPMRKDAQFRKASIASLTAAPTPQRSSTVSPASTPPTTKRRKPLAAPKP
jgi:TolA-binding protein